MRPILLLAIAVTACAGHGGTWPSLARRPIEGLAPVATGRCARFQTSCMPSTGGATPATDGTARPLPGRASEPAMGDAAATPRPAEPGQVGAPRIAPSPATPADGANGGAAGQVVADAAARLAVIAGDLDDLATRAAAARQAAAAAFAAAQGAPAASPAWAKAELERTALDRIGNQIDDLRQRLDAVSGTLAVAAADGGAVATPLATAGRLIARTDALQREQAAAVAPPR